MAQIAQQVPFTERRPMSGAGAAIAGQTALPQLTQPQIMAQAAYDGPRSVKDRDSFRSEFARTGEAGLVEKPAPYMKWKSEVENRMRPVVFKPNGSFQALRDQGKLVDKFATPASEHVRLRGIMREKKYIMPGYTGFVRGMQHISGRTFGEATRRAYDTDFREHACTSPIPSAPQTNRKIEQIPLEDTFSSNTFSGKVYQVPGYTGFVPGVRHTYAMTYGSSTSQEMYKNSIRDPRKHPQERPGYAYTTKPRQFYGVDSAPLPGASMTDNAPDKLIPSHLNYLRFFPM